MSYESKLKGSIKLRVAIAKLEDSIMGRKYKNIFDKIVDIDNIRDAYLKTCKGKNKYSRGHLIFKENLEYNLYRIQQELIKEKYKTGNYYTFEVFEPKKRIISALPFKDRVVQHSINNIIEPIFERTFYSCSYGCRKNKGVHKGVIEVQATIRRLSSENKKLYCLKMDFKKYFASINPIVLKKEIENKIKDNRTLRIIYLFISKYGVKIGNLLSQLLANVYGHIYDRFVKIKLKVKNYFRYVDDSIIISNDKNYLITIQKKIKKFIGIFLKLNFSRWSIEDVQEKSINFLGYRIRKTSKLIRKSSLTNAKRKIKKYLRYNQKEKLRSFLGSWHGHIQWADNKKLKLHLQRYTA